MVPINSTYLHLEQDTSLIKEVLPSSGEDGGENIGKPLRSLSNFRRTEAFIGDLFNKIA